MKSCLDCVGAFFMSWVKVILYSYLILKKINECLKLLKQYRTIEQMCSDAHSITLRWLSVKMSIKMLKKIALHCTYSSYKISLNDNVIKVFWN